MEILLSVALVVLAIVCVCWWLSGFSARSVEIHRLYVEQVRSAEIANAENQRLYTAQVKASEVANAELTALYRESIELSKEGQRLIAESNSLKRELIAALRVHSSERQG